MQRVIRTILLVATIGCLGSAPLVAAQVIVQASDDTWIEDLDDTGNHGNEFATAICPTANYWIYLKFDVGSAAVGTLDAAELRMTRIDGSRPDEISVYLISDDGWTEGSLTGVNRPAPTNPSNGAALGVGQVQAGYDRWMSAAITSTILAQAAGDGTLSLMLREDPAPMLDIRHYRTTESPVGDANKPQLVLDLSPAEVTNLIVTGRAPTRLAWDAGSGTVHDVAGGLISELHTDGGVDSASCLVDDHGSTSYDDPRPNPAAGAGYYYVARAQIGVEGGTYGADSSGSERVPAGACP